MQSMSLANSSIQEEESKSKFILATNQRQRWNALIENVPKTQRVYIKASFKQLKLAQKDYQDWGNYEPGFEEIVDKEKSKGKKFSAQGIMEKPDFPKIEIVVPDDALEMETQDKDW